jgi:hypothetical protein
MPRLVRTNRTLRCVKLFCFIGMSMFIIVIIKRMVCVVLEGWLGILV